MRHALVLLTVLCAGCADPIAARWESSALPAASEAPPGATGASSFDLSADGTFTALWWHDHGPSEPACLTEYSATGRWSEVIGDGTPSLRFAYTRILARERGCGSNETAREVPPETYGGVVTYEL